MPICHLCHVRDSVLPPRLPQKKNKHKCGAGRDFRTLSLWGLDATKNKATKDSLGRESRLLNSIQAASGHSSTLQDQITARRYYIPLCCRGFKSIQHLAQRWVKVMVTAVGFFFFEFFTFRSAARNPLAVAPVLQQPTSCNRLQLLGKLTLEKTHSDTLIH